MLKKEETLPGAIVEVYRLKDGLGGDKDHVLITTEAGGVFDGGYGVDVGVRLTIVEAPKRRGGINTAVVKVLPDERTGDKREIQGHVFWCELRASCKLEKAAPGSGRRRSKKKPKKNPNEFTEFQLNRLPEHGYWVELYDGEPTSFICVKNGKVKYVKSPRADQWNSLLWNCCPTAKQIKAKPEDFRFFATHEELLAAFPNAEGPVREPAPNDF